MLGGKTLAHEGVSVQWVLEPLEYAPYAWVPTIMQFPAHFGNTSLGQVPHTGFISI